MREALSLLTSDQLVERLDQRGFRVAQTSRAQFDEILKLRCQLEVLALKESLEHADSADPETLARIEQYELAYRMQASVPEAVDLDEAVEPDLEPLPTG